MTTTDTTTATTTTRPTLDEVAAAARAAFATTVASTAVQRSAWLTAVADALDGAAGELIPLADEESHLGAARLTGELARTTAQLRLFASAVVEGSYLEATIDHPNPSTTPPRPDLRRMLRPLGPVAGREAGVALVQHPEIRAVGFTGSLHGGRALFDLASSRPDPIPFYGELSAVNPVLITAAALDARADELASGLAASFTLGAGQFCTNPGVVFVPAGSGFAERVAAAVGQTAPVPMLTDGIAAAFADGLAGLVAHDGVEVVAGETAQRPGTGSAVVLSTTTAAVLADPGALLAECFGPSTLVVEYDDVDDALAAIRSVGGSLTATVHAEPGEDLADILAVLTEVAGRVLFAGWPTGVAVSWAQQHGGPWPSTTSIHTSVGVTAIRRFLRPVAYQDAPDAVLPLELRESNPLGIPRRVDGVLVVPGSPRDRSA